MHTKFVTSTRLSLRGVVQIYNEFVRVRFLGGEDAYGKTVGLLGDYATGQTLARDGSTVLNDFIALGNEWQVLPSEVVSSNGITPVSRNVSLARESSRRTASAIGRKHTISGRSRKGMRHHPA